MKCLKCGVEISEDEVFCLECQLDAQRYPVDPATAVYLPRRETVEAPKKASRRRTLTSAQQIRSLRRRLRLQTVALVLLAAIALVLAYPALSYMTRTHYRPGQNYSAVTQTTAAAVTGPSETGEP